MNTKQIATVAVGTVFGVVIAGMLMYAAKDIGFIDYARNGYDM